MIEKVETLEPKGSKTGSGWIIQSFDSLYVDMYETKPLRGSSYIPTPAKYSNSKFGLINIQNDDQECFRWCMRYHQSEKKNDHRISALKKVKDKYDYGDMSFPADFESIEKFEIKNQVCIYIYSMNDENEIRLSKAGNIDYINQDLIYLLTLEDNDQTH